MRKLAIVYPTALPFTYTAFVERVLNLRVPAGYELRWLRGQGWSPARRHIHGLQQALAWGADLILLLDPDEVPPPDLLPRMVATLDGGWADAVTAVVPLRRHGEGVGPAFSAGAWVEKDQRTGQLERVPVRDETSLVPVDACGLGAFMFRAEVLEKLRQPWMKEKVKRADGVRDGTHDVRFTFRLTKELGLRLMRDNSLRVGHLDVFEIDGTFAERFDDWNDHGHMAIDKEILALIRQTLPQGSVVVEMGSGTGSRQLARWYEVYSIEHDYEWAHAGHAPRVIHAPLDDSGWYSREAIAAGLPEHYDLILADGCAKRDGFLTNLDLFRPDVPIVFDDLQFELERETMQALATKLGRPCEVYAGETCLFGLIPL